MATSNSAPRSRAVASSSQRGRGGVGIPDCILAYPTMRSSSGPATLTLSGAFTFSSVAVAGSSEHRPCGP